MARYSAFSSMAAVQDGAVARAVAGQQALMAALYAATALPGAGQRLRSLGQSDTLLARGDPKAIQRVQQYAPYLSAAERAQVDRRAV